MPPSESCLLTILQDATKTSTSHLIGCCAHRQTNHSSHIRKFISGSRPSNTNIAACAHDIRPDSNAHLSKNRLPQVNLCEMDSCAGRSSDDDGERGLQPANENPARLHRSIHMQHIVAARIALLFQSPERPSCTFFKMGVSMLRVLAQSVYHATSPRMP